MNGYNDEFKLERADFLKKAERVFAEHCLAKFDFLEKEFSLKFSGYAICYESIAVYSNESISIGIVFSIPEAPFVEISGVGKKKNVRLRPGRKAKKLIEKYMEDLERQGFNEWFEKFRSGDLDMSIIGILDALAVDVRILWGRCLTI